MNRHQGLNTGSSVYQPSQNSPVLEGEKCTILPGRKKRQSNAQDVILPEIRETDERQVMHENVMDSRAPHVGHMDCESESKRYRTSSFSAFENERNEKRQNEKVKEDESGKVKSRGHKKRGSHGHISDHESVAESEEKVQEEVSIDKTNIPTVRRKSKESNKVNQAVDTTVPMFDILNVGSEYRHRKMDEMTEKSSSSKSGAKSVIVEDSGSSGLKLPEVRCAHHVIRPDLDEREEKLRQTLKWKRGKDSDTGKCVICEITEATARYASVESNRLLLEIVYPHEYYDKYSRATKKAQPEPDNQKETISICKPFKVAKKPRREKTFVQTPLFSDRPDPPSTMREGTELQEKSENEFVTQDRKRKRELTETGFRKEIHLQCKPKANALVITDGCEGQKMVLKGLKGWILRRDDVCKDRVHKEIKQSLYQVNSLGMQFSIPEYNNALHDRKPMSPRPITSLTTSRLCDVQSTFQLQRSYTQSPRGNQFILQADVSKDTPNVIQRGKTHLNLQRDPTNASINKLLTHSAGQENSRPNVTFKNQTGTSSSYSSRGSDGSNHGKLLKGKLSLPPIAPDHKPTSALSIGKHTT